MLHAKNVKFARFVCQSRPTTAWFRGLCLLATFAAVLVTIGCRGEALSHVHGKITFRGAVVDHGVVNFIGADNQPRGGPIDADGTYGFDVPPGSYDVIVSAPAQLPDDWVEGQPFPELEGAVPEKYGARGSSGLSIVVSEKNQLHDFDLK